MATKTTSIVTITLIVVCFFTIIVGAETAEDYNEKGNVFIDHYEYEKAIECFDKAIELDPNFIDAYSSRGNVYNYLKQYDKAIADFDRTIILNPDYAEVYYSRGRAYSGLGQYESAIEDYNKAIELDSNFTTGAYNNRGNVYYFL